MAVNAVVNEYLDRLDEAQATQVATIEREVASQNNPALAQALERPIRTAKLREGLYYSKISDLWVGKQLELINGAMATAFHRSKIPQGYQSIAILDDRSDVERYHIAQTKDTSLTSKARQRLYPNDIFGNTGTGEIAHLIPNAPGCSVYFEDVGEWVMALKPLKEKKRVRSSKRRMTADDLDAKRRKMVVNGYRKSRRGKRETNSALKQHVFNHIRLKFQGTYLDTYPCVMIVPLVDMEFLRTWSDGIPYEAMVVVGASTGGGEQKLAHQVCQDIGMTRRLPCCSPNELRGATELISCALHALANSMIGKERAHFNRATMYRDELLGTYDKLKNSNSISVPVLNSALEGLKIAKIKFGKFGDEEQVHVAVDPMLLLLKAAVVLSARFGERLLPACPPEAKDWDSADEAMAQAYLEQERLRWIAPNMIQVADGNCDDIGSLSD